MSLNTREEDELPTSDSSFGYRRLADFMAWTPSQAIFHRFRAANALNLLGLQAEVARLQEQLLEATKRDEEEEDTLSRRQYQQDWAALWEGEPGTSQQAQLVLQLRNALNEYSESLERPNQTLEMLPYEV
jgi:hypothetical protein